VAATAAPSINDDSYNVESHGNVDDNIDDNFRISQQQRSHLVAATSHERNRDMFSKTLNL